MKSLIGAAAAVLMCMAGFGAVHAQTQTPAAAPAASQEIPREWVDQDTGHRIVRLSNEPDTSSLYFHQNGYLPEGDKLIVSSPTGIYAIDLATRDVSPIVQDPNVNLLFTGRNNRDIYYSKRVNQEVEGGPTDIFAVNADTRESRRIVRLERGSIGSVNADGTLLLGTVAEQQRNLQPGSARARDRRFDQADYQANWPDGTPMSFADAKEVRINNRLNERIPMEIFTIDIRTGERKVVHAATDWLNHIQFSPTDPNLIMFCHEGPWHRVDRIWTIRTDGTGLQNIHRRTMNMEIAGHEWMAQDGKTIWYDLQTPRGQKFWVAGYNMETGVRTWYHLERDEWSVHFNSSHDGSLFSGDGGDAEMVARAPDGKWIYLFRPEAIPDVAGIHADNAADLIHPGILRSERLVNMQKHDYRLEPNATFTPDNKWIVFRSNMFGPTHVFAVEVARADGAAPAAAQP